MKSKKYLNSFVLKLKNDYLKSDISRYIYHIILSTILGLLSGAGAIFFHSLLGRMKFLFNPEHFSRIFNTSSYFIFIIPVIGGVVIAVMTRIFNKISKERGVTAVIKSIVLNNGYMSYKSTIYHFLAPIISIGTGAPLGPEGPAARLGSGIGSFLSQVFRLNQKDMRMYTAAGAGAAISAIFNAPITGVFFGLEVILMNDLKNQALSALIIASVVADILSRSVIGTHYIFRIPAYNPGNIGEYPAFFLMGIASGLTCLFYFWIKSSSNKILNEKLKIYNQFFKLIPITIIFGIILIKYYNLFGIGYETINDIINSKIDVTTVSILLILKIIFLALFLNAGAYGGTFAPSLSIGVMLGYTFSIMMNNLFGLTLDPVIFSLIGMGGILSGINSIPLTSVLLVFEVTNDYKFILPLMVVSIVSYLITVHYNKGTVYTKALLKIGIDVSKKGEVDLLGKIFVQELMIKEFDKVSYKLPFKELINVLIKSKHGDVIVMDNKSKIMGIITLNDIRQTLQSTDLVDFLIAGDIAAPVPVITEKDRVSSAIQKFNNYDIENIPVVTSKDKEKVIGIIKHQDIIHAYHKLLEEWETDQFLVNYQKK